MIDKYYVFTNMNADIEAAKGVAITITSLVGYENIKVEKITACGPIISGITDDQIKRIKKDFTFSVVKLSAKLSQGFFKDDFRGVDSFKD